jgi:hypothetical protein
MIMAQSIFKNPGIMLEGSFRNGFFPIRSTIFTIQKLQLTANISHQFRKQKSVGCGVRAWRLSCFRRKNQNSLAKTQVTRR